MEKRERSITIVNRLYPPNPGVTGESAFELANYLYEVHGYQVNIIHVAANYYGITKKNDDYSHIYKVRSAYRGRNKPLRFIGSLIDGYRLISIAKRLTNGFTIVMTDPPLLSMWASLRLGGKKQWALWSMDIYPQAFVAGGMASPRNTFYRIFNRQTYQYPPSLLIALGEKQRAFVEQSYSLNIRSVVLPCGICQEEHEDIQPPAWYTPDKIIFGYCGNLGEAHDVKLIEAVLPLIDARKHVFVLSAYGKHADYIRKMAAQFPHVVHLDFVPRYYLKYIDIHLVTLLETWTHICVPSKAFTAVSMGSTLLFSGSKECDIWQELGSAGWYIRTGKELHNDVNQFMKDISHEDIKSKRDIAVTLAGKLIRAKEEASKEIAEQISSSFDT